MADLLIAGSFAFDTINTQTARRERILGGTGTHASYGASFFTKVFASGIVGNDWLPEYSQAFINHGIDVQNLEVKQDKKTSFWEAIYSKDMNQRDTLEFQANVLADYAPNLTADARACPYLLLANNPPAVQMEIIRQCTAPKFIMADTMDFYINSVKDELLELLKQIHAMILNDGEARLLSGKYDLFDAGDAIRAMGPELVIIKKGEHGSIFMMGDDVCVFPAYPTRKVVDPTGAGDCFVGALMGFLASQEKLDFQILKEAMMYATVTASFTIEDFSFDALTNSTRADIDARYEHMRQMLRF